MKIFFPYFPWQPVSIAVYAISSVMLSPRTTSFVTVITGLVWKYSVPLGVSIPAVHVSSPSPDKCLVYGPSLKYDMIASLCLTIRVPSHATYTGCIYNA